ncbi:hypothetical protein Tsubulata_009384 [Turnera subulata]|uniref:Uncharacterized protein n=1 Tax=Turnera subulata TaxID=218843 RepID=A0A9Q0G0D3_9ROSI|nr:hypothetical protein Tsubulata_009384 [Turnera subulata]
MGRSACPADSTGLRRGPWTPEEDQRLLTYIQKHGHGSWGSLPQKAGLKRCGKSCRLRWINYLRPDIKRGKFSRHEDQSIIQLHALLGNRWSAIAAYLPKRTDNEIKNYWNTQLKKRLEEMGIDPMTHRAKHTSNLSHMAQWESARLEAEARLVRQSKLCRVQEQDTQNNGSPAVLPPARLFNRRAAASSKIAPTRCLDILKAWQSIHDVRGVDEFGFNAGTHHESPTSAQGIVSEQIGDDFGRFNGGDNTECAGREHQLVWSNGDLSCNKEPAAFQLEDRDLMVADMIFDNTEFENSSLCINFQEGWNLWS